MSLGARARAAGKARQGWPYPVAHAPSALPNDGPRGEMPRPPCEREPGGLGQIQLPGWRGCSAGLTPGDPGLGASERTWRSRGVEVPCSRENSVRGRSPAGEAKEPVGPAGSSSSSLERQGIRDAPACIELVERIGIGTPASPPLRQPRVIADHLPARASIKKGLSGPATALGRKRAALRQRDCGLDQGSSLVVRKRGRRCGAELTPSGRYRAAVWRCS